MITLILLLLSGVFEGVMDTLQFHYSRFQKRHKKAKDKFWNPEYSWLNKYNSQMKPLFIGSTTVFCWLTDGWHLFKFLRNITFFSSIYFIDSLDFILWLAVTGFFINRVGFALSYKLFYK